MIKFRIFVFLSIVNSISAGCPSGWQLFNRVQSDWCIRVFPGTVARQVAEEYCRRQGGTLTGIETASERNYITSKALAIINSVGARGGGSVWIGAKRRHECLGKYRSDAQCLPSGNNAMEWTDNHTTGKSGFYWRPSEPDYFLNAQPFVFMHVFPGGVGIAKIRTGMMSDIGSEMTISKELPFQTIQAYACGQSAN